jgi:cell division protein FtsA
MRKIVASLDLGSSLLKLIIGEVYKNRVNVLACVTSTSRGIKNGFIVNPESAVESLEELVHKANDIMGIPIKKVIVAIPPLNFESYMAEGTSFINSEDHVITMKDVSKALDNSVEQTVSPNMQLVSISPVHFIVDDKEKVANPVGMIAGKLSIKSVLGVVPKKNIMPIIRCLEKLEVEVLDTVLAPLGDYYELKSKDTNERVGALINLGASVTTVSIFNKGILTNSEVINIGGDTVDNDICYVYKVSRQDAIYLKENLALAHKAAAQPNESLIISNKMGDQIKVNQYDISEICMQRLEEILNLAKKQINLLTKKEISYIIVTGGLTEFVDFPIILDEVFNHKAQMGNVEQIGIRNNKYVTSYGLIKYFNSKMKMKNQDYSIFSIEEQEEIGGSQKRININENSILGKLFGYFFDN